VEAHGEAEGGEPRTLPIPDEQWGTGAAWFQVQASFEIGEQGRTIGRITGDRSVVTIKTWAELGKSEACGKVWSL
jgi:hypothetical protein